MTELVEQFATVVVADKFEVNTRQEPVIFLRHDSPVARSEGFDAMSRVNIAVGKRTITATLIIVGEHVLSLGTAGLSIAAKKLLRVSVGEPLKLSYPKPVASLAYLRSKIYGNSLSEDQYCSVIADIVAGRYMDVHLSAFITACSGIHMSRDEIVYLTSAMVKAGKQINWPHKAVFDKHCVGGLPGNRTTPIVVAIAAANGLIVPKTSSRAITSPAGTADVMETLTRVDLDIDEMQSVVEKEGACLAWGGSMNLSPADDVLIRVEKALDIDSTGQLVASILSKKIAAGSTDVVIDLPVGATAKVRSDDAARSLTEILQATGAALGINVHVLQTDGSQPIGYGIGPALEAHDVLAVLKGERGGPQDLRARALALAAKLLESADIVEVGKGQLLATKTLDSGKAYAKFEAICEAQGALKEPPLAAYHYDVFSDQDGKVTSIDNRVLARIAKLAGAPVDKAAGVKISAKLDDVVKHGEVLYTIHAESSGELEYALAYAREQRDVIKVSG